MNQENKAEFLEWLLKNYEDPKLEIFYGNNKEVIVILIEKIKDLEKKLNENNIEVLKG